MHEWIRVIAVDEGPADGRGLELVADGRVVALFRDGDEFFALEGICSHQGGPLGKGIVCHGAVACPWHGWLYDLRTGINRVNPEVRQIPFAVKVADGAIWIRERATGNG